MCVEQGNICTICEGKLRVVLKCPGHKRSEVEVGTKLDVNKCAAHRLLSVNIGPSALRVPLVSVVRMSANIDHAVSASALNFRTHRLRLLTLWSELRERLDMGRSDTHQPGCPRCFGIFSNFRRVDVALTSWKESTEYLHIVKGRRTSCKLQVLPLIPISN